MVRAFLLSVFGGKHKLLESGVGVRPRYDDFGVVDNLESTWAAFSVEIQTTNRYFPSRQVDTSVLDAVVRSHATTFDSGLDLYRGRVVDEARALPPAEMGSPPSHKARPGRANSLGIRHLYVALEEATAIRECRAVQHNYVSLGRFRTLPQRLEFLDLVELRPENPFLINGNHLVERLSYGRYMALLGRELSKPTRTSDNQLEYIPTQYLCDFVKSMGLAGVRYRSSLASGGNNLVVFDEANIECVESYLVDVRSMSLDYVRVN